MNVCIDDSNIIQQNSSRLTTLSGVDSLIATFEKNIVSTDTTAIQQMISLYGKEAFDNSVLDVNRFLYIVNGASIPTQLSLSGNIQVSVTPIDFADYPDLKNRIDQGTSITPIEVAEFMVQFLSSPFAIQTQLQTNQPKCLKQLDTFYGDSFTKSSMGSFCALAPSIFGAIEGFFSAVNSLATKINDLIGKIQNLSVAVLINQLKEKIKQVVDKVIEKVKGIVENFSVANVMSKVETFVNENIIGKAHELKEKAMSFFSEENLKAFKEKIEGLLSYAIGVFKDPSLEEIQFLVYRFCSFISNVEDILNDIKGPLDNFSNSFNEAYNIIKSNGDINTVRAIQSGALRFDSQTRRSSIDQMQGNTRATGTANPAPIAIADVEGVTSWNNGRGDAKIKFGAGLQPGRMGEEGWIRVDPKARVYLMRVQARFGKQLQVNSGYRSPAYNSGRGAKSSKHMAGQAIDVTWNGMTTQSREEFINIAYEEGFLGIGRYGTRFVHVDLGPKRSWNG